MKLVRLLDAPATALLYDLHNQIMLKELVEAECSVGELAERLNIPMVTVWKRMQKLLSANLVELSGIKKTGNLERKMYRATAARFIPAQLLTFKPKNRHLQEALEIFARIQNMGLALMAQKHDIPAGEYPFDYVLYENMRAFVEVSKMPEFHRGISELEERLSAFELSKEL
jgi:DNA-binding Lrp family transcriptional regulator